MNRTISIKSPATIANLVCGFDIIGLALEEPFDLMTLTLTDKPGLTITHVDGFLLPENPEDNVAGAALISLMENIDQSIGFEMIIDKRIKPGSGLGSSAASAAGAVYAANKLLNDQFSNNDLIRFAMNGEKVASGVKHADNITPCLLGGVTLIRSIHPLDTISISSPELFISVVHPQIEVKTSDARQILKEEVALKKAIKQWGNIAGLVAGLMQSDYELIGRSLEDVIIEPVRSILIPAFSEVKSKCLESGALGGGISGSGPSIFMLHKNRESAEKSEKIMAEIYTRIGIDHKTYVTKLNHQGIQITQ